MLFGVARFSALQRAEIAEIALRGGWVRRKQPVSVLFNEPKLLKLHEREVPGTRFASVSVLFNEPKLLKSFERYDIKALNLGFSALQRAEIAEIVRQRMGLLFCARFSALQRAEIAEIDQRRRRKRLRRVFQCSSTSRNC